MQISTQSDRFRFVMGWLVATLLIVCELGSADDDPKSDAKSTVAARRLEQMVRFLLDSGANRKAISGTSLTHPSMTLKQLLNGGGWNVPHFREILEILDHT